jgi:pentatricopeptide repeat protein
MLARLTLSGLKPSFIVPAFPTIGPRNQLSPERFQNSLLTSHSRVSFNIFSLSQRHVHKMNCGKHTSAGYGFMSKRRRKKVKDSMKDEIEKLNQKYLNSPDLDPALGVMSRNSFYVKMSQLVRKGNILDVYNEVESKKKLGYKPDMKMYTSLMNGFRVAGLYQKALEVAEESKKLPETPSLTWYNVLMSIYSRLGRVKEMEEVLGQIKEARKTPSEGTYMTLIRKFSDLGDEAKVLHYYEKFRKERILDRSVGMYNAILKMYVERNDQENVTKWLKDMLQRKIKPNGQTRILVGEYVQKDPILQHVMKKK